MITEVDDEVAINMYEAARLEFMKWNWISMILR